MNTLKLLTVLMSARRWGHLWNNMHIIVNSDSLSSVGAINKGTSQSPMFMCCLRELFWLGVKHNIHLTARHVRGIHNGRADMISRLHMPEMVCKFVNIMNPVYKTVNVANNMSFSTFLML